LVFDAEQYLQLAQSGAATLQADPVRTWGYPWFLGIIDGFAEFIGSSPIILAWLAQTAIYILCSVFFAKSLKRGVHTNLAFAVLMLNVLVAPYHSVLLTDSLSTSLALLVIGVGLRVGSSNTLATTLAITLGFSFAVAVRPASIWLAPIVIFYFLFIFFRDRRSLVPSLAVSSVGIIPLLVQSFLNMKSFSQITPLPAGDLGASQIAWGITNFKYATTIHPVPARLYYPTSSFIGPFDSYDVGWYFDNPVLALQVLFMKLVSAFDWDYIVVYNVNPGYPSLVGLAVIALLVFGILFSVLNLTAKGEAVGPKALPVIVFLGWAAVVLPSAIELRFVLPMAAFFAVTVVIGFYQLWHMSRKWTFLVAIIGFSVVGALVPIALFVRGTMVLPG
jgi:hypothetical protein